VAGTVVNALAPAAEAGLPVHAIGLMGVCAAANCERITKHSNVRLRSLGEQNDATYFMGSINIK
jgi:hypothetical protein